MCFGNIQYKESLFTFNLQFSVHLYNAFKFLCDINKLVSSANKIKKNNRRLKTIEVLKLIPVIPHIWFPPVSKVLIHRGEKHPTKIVFISETIVLYCFTREHRSLLCWLSTLHHILFFASIRIPSVFCIFICFCFRVILKIGMFGSMLPVKTSTW